MSSETTKICEEASDLQTDEDCEVLLHDGFMFSTDIFEKKTRRKITTGKPPSSPRSPYLSRLNVKSRTAAVAAWRLPRPSLGDVTGDGVSARHTSLSNGHAASQKLRSEYEVTPGCHSMKKQKHLTSGFNGVTTYTGVHRDKEDMIEEIIRLKKNLHAQKSDNQLTKAKLRRLEEDNARREKQIEELLDPTKGSHYARSFVDQGIEGSVVFNGLRQKNLKLEQQCREKEKALSNLQSELRTTNLEELKISVEMYSEEIKRLEICLEAAEKSSRAESKCSQRQQKALSSMVHRLSEDLKQLRQENTVLKEELNTDSPAGGIKGYREWSKQRLLRRLLEVEKRLEDSKRHAHSPKSSSQLDQEVQTSPTEILGFTMATEAVVSVGVMTEEWEEVSHLREAVSQLEKEKAELQERLSSKDDDLKQLRTGREELEKETELWKAEQTKERDKESQQHKEQLDQLWARIQTLEDRSKAAQAELLPLSATSPEDNKDNEDTHAVSRLVSEEERDTGGKDETKTGEDEASTTDEAKRARERAALVIQTSWREHRRRDIVMLQSALRGHLFRESHLKDLQEDGKKKAEEAINRVASPAEGELDVDALTKIQSAFRGHLARCEFANESSEFSVPSLPSRDLPILVPRRARSAHKPSRAGEEKHDEVEDPLMDSSKKTPETVQTELHCTTESDGAAAVDSDDSDDIIVSPSRPVRSREVLLP